MKRLLLCFPLLCVALPSAAQTPAMPMPGTVANVAVDPIRCWWRTSAGFVRTGETFELSLTCAVLETEAVQAVPDETRLGAAVIQLAPFEVVGGRHPADLRSGSRRFFQYHYTLRVINPDAIGKDVKLPPLAIHYAVNDQVATRTAVQSRDLVYMLPEQSIRVASMVPADAPDIRDAAGEDFGEVESLGFRSKVLQIAAMTSAALGGLMVLAVAIGAIRRAARRTPADERVLPIRSLVGAAARELASVGSDREQQGWNEALVGRALAATRIAAGCAIGRTPSQRLADGSTTGEGRLVVPGVLRGKPRSLSSSTTAVDVTRAIDRDAAGDPDRAQMLAALRDAMAAFSMSQYGRQVPIDQTSLDAALAGAGAAASRVKGEHSWLTMVWRRLRGASPAEARA